MSPEMVERVAARLRAMYDPTRPSMDAIARWALALAERAAREAFSGAEVEPGNLALLAKAAVQRAVEDS